MEGGENICHHRLSLIQAENGCGGGHMGTRTEADIEGKRKRDEELHPPSNPRELLELIKDFLDPNEK